MCHFEPQGDDMYVASFGFYIHPRLEPAQVYFGFSVYNIHHRHVAINSISSTYIDTKHIQTIHVYSCTKYKHSPNYSYHDDHYSRIVMHTKYIIIFKLRVNSFKISFEWALNSLSRWVRIKGHVIGDVISDVTIYGLGSDVTDWTISIMWPSLL